MRIMWACLLSFLLAPPALAEVFKWVDANGVTHYGEQPPAKGQSKSLKLEESSPRLPGKAGAAPAPPSLSERELEFRKRQVTRAQEEAQQAQEKARREQRCRTARAALVNLRATPRLYDLDQSGQRVYLSDAERDAAVAKREAEYSRQCE